MASSPSFTAPPQCVDNLAGSAIATLEKPVHHDNPVEPVRLKLQDPVGCPSDSLWSSQGLKSRSSLLFSVSQALSERPSSFTLRAPRLQSKADSRTVHSGQTTPLSESDDGEVVAVDNQKEDHDEHDALSKNVGELSISWGTAQKQSSKGNQPVNKHELESLRLSLNVDIWRNPHNDFEDSDFSSTVSPTTSTDRQSFPRSSATAVPAMSSRGDSNTVGCRVPPGMSLIDQSKRTSLARHHPNTSSSKTVVCLVADFHLEEEINSLCSINNEGIGQLKLGNYRSAQPYDPGRRSGHDFEDLPWMPQHAFDPSLAGVNIYRHAFGRCTSEPPFGGSYHGATVQGYPSPYDMEAQRAQSYVVMGAAKSRWAANEDTHSIKSSSFGYASPVFAVPHPVHGSAMSTYPAGYAGEHHGVKYINKIFKAHPSYPLVDRPLYGLHDFGSYVSRPRMLHRLNVGGPRRNVFEYFHPVAHSYSSNSPLEEFNSAPKSEKRRLSAIKGHLFLFAKDQTGSRFVQ